MHELSGPRMTVLWLLPVSGFSSQHRETAEVSHGAEYTQLNWCVCFFWIYSESSRSLLSALATRLPGTGKDCVHSVENTSFVCLLYIVPPSGSKSADLLIQIGPHFAQ
jgi:hypothetical protein